MNSKKLISKLVTQICSEDFSRANITLDTIISEKVKNRVKKLKNNSKKETAKDK